MMRSMVRTRKLWPEMDDRLLARVYNVLATETLLKMFAGRTIGAIRERAGKLRREKRLKAPPDGRRRPASPESKEAVDRAMRQVALAGDERR